MSIQDTDYFLIEDNDGVVKKITALKLKEEITGTYSSNKLLVGLSDNSSRFVYAGDLYKLTSSHYLILDRGGQNYKVNGTKALEYFPVVNTSAPFDISETSGLDAFATYMQARKTNWAGAGTNFQYETDNYYNPQSISDGTSDMYDNGNQTSIAMNSARSSYLNYNLSGTYNNVVWETLGYSWPLVAIAVGPDDALTTYGMARVGNLGADNYGGTPYAITVYDNATVGPFDMVYAWMVNKSYNQSADPHVGHLYCTVGSTNWDSNITNGFYETYFNPYSDQDYSTYQSTSQKAFVMTALLSKGQYASNPTTVDEARTFVDNFLADAATYFGF